VIREGLNKNINKIGGIFQFSNCDPYPPSHLAEYLGEEQDTSQKFSMEETFENFLYNTKLVSKH
jgi:hypothetical protein